MPSFTFKARTGEGQLISGAMDVASEAIVTRDLRARGLYPVEVKATKLRPSLLSTLLSRKRVKNDERVLFLRQFEAMIRAGLPITTSLAAIADQAVNPALTEMLTQIREDIEGGSTLAQAFRRQPALLPGIHVSLIEAGEQGGILDEILQRICELVEYDVETKARIRSATFYPGIVIGELLLGFVVIVRFVFPRFKALFASKGAELPLPTRVMIAISDVVTDYWWHMVIGSLVVAVALYRYVRSERGRTQLDAIALKLPIFGEMLLMIMMSRFARVLSSLLESGVPFLRSLAIVERTIDNRTIQDEVTFMAKGIQKGRSIAESIRGEGCFPPAVVKMLEVGEKAGKINEMLLRVSTFYDRQVDYRIKNLTTILEPILLVVLGAGVLFTALAVFLPMWDMSRVVMGG